MNSGLDVGADDKGARLWGLLLHVSALAGYMIPLGGLIIPILIWQLKKEQYPVLDQHGKNLMNWLISAVIYAGVCFLLSFFFIGILLGVALGVATVVFPIIAGIQAHEGVVWKYPLAISFI